MSFQGFAPAAVEFYQRLELDNDRDWWAAQLATYQDAVRAPMLALAAELEAEFGPAKLFRPHRDVRFSTDKSPYKTHQGLFVQSVAGLGWYLQLAGDGLFVAGGFYAHAPDQVARFRAAVDDDPSGEQLTSIVEGLRSAGYVIGGDVLRTRPRGVPADHRRIDLLRHRSLTASVGYGEPPWLATPETLDRVRADWRAMRPLVAWLGEWVGAAAPHEEGFSRRRGRA